MEIKDKICNNCVNKHLNDEGRLFCWKGVDTSNITAVCNFYNTEEIDTDFILERKSETYSEKKIKLFFLICFFLPIVVFILITLFLVDVNLITIIIIFVIVAFEFLPIISLYKGKFWAKRLFNISISFNVFGSFYTLGKFETSSDILMSIFSIIFNTYILYFINFDKDFRLFFNSKTND